MCALHLGQSFKKVDSYGIYAAFLWDFFEASKCRLQSFPDLIPEPDRGIFLCVDFGSIFCSGWSQVLGCKRAGIAIGERWCYREERAHPPVLAEANTKHGVPP